MNYQTEERYQHFISFLPTYNILILKKRVGLGLCQFRQYFSYIMAVSFIGGENWRAQRKPPTYRKWLTNFITLHLYVVCSTPRRGYAYFVIQLNIANCKLLFPFQQKKTHKKHVFVFLGRNLESILANINYIIIPNSRLFCKYSYVSIVYSWCDPVYNTLTVRDFVLLCYRK